MSILAWNCQGLGAPMTGKRLKNICKNNKPSLVFLMEIKVQKNKVEKIISRCFNRSSCFYIDLEGLSGGLALWWKEE